MPDEPDPPRKFYKLGEAKFERVNEAAPPPVEGAISGAAGNAPPNAAPPKENDVHRILLENRSIDKAGGLFDLAPKPKRKSRRKRDYWLLMAVFNGFFGAAILHFGLRSIVGLFAFSGIILFSAGFTWVMWLIMDDY